jgi:glycerol-1-phosphate dehydrogenase [NAD(P)+]
VAEAELDKRIGSLLGRRARYAGGFVHSIPTQAVVIGPQALQALPSLVDRYFPPGPVLLVADEQTFAAAGEAVVGLLGARIVPYVLTPRRDQLICDEAMVTEVRGYLRCGPVAAIAVGAGTINDLVKLAASHEGLPYGVVATAASMNGYTSPIASLYAGGLKHSVPAAPPLWVVGDLEVLAAAPIELTRAGLADLLSKPVSSADWRAASLLADERYCPLAVRVAERAEAVCRAQAERIGAGQPEAVALLFRGLVLSGFSMTLAGSSAPASGGEHLIAHLWDLRRLQRGERLKLHGAQVGVATLMTAALWQLLAEQPPLTATEISRLLASRPPWRQEAALLSRRLGSLAAPCRAEYRCKRPTKAALRARLEKLAATWSQFWAQVGRLLKPPDLLRETLQAAGAPTTLRELGLAPAAGVLGLTCARFLRRRYTVLDLAADLGVLEQLVPRALRLSGVLS